MTTYPFLHAVEIVDDDTDKQIEDKESSDYNEHYKVEICVEIRFEFRLLVNL